MEQLEQEEVTIDLRELLQILKKRIFLIIIVTLLATLASAILSYFVLIPTYEASTEILVNRTETDANTFYSTNDIQTNLKLIETYNVIIKSPRIIDMVISKYNLSLTSEELTQKISVNAVKDSQVMSIVVTDPSQSEAAKIANAVADTFQQEIVKIMRVDNVQVLTNAKVLENPKPVKPQPLLNIAIAFAVGFMTSVGIVFLLEYLDNTIRSEQQVEQLLGYPVLGAISKMEENSTKKRKSKRKSANTSAKGRAYEA
ncbi:Wzz/FepE/Etk N-terminal domain-containing protein [Tepidibacillus marianensis]|uniref:YveK family protein n=1 Tax=Tepidibacillus marianensis TaxID=3131995 RepID=UPI0030D317E0